MATIPIAAPVLPKSLQFMASRLSNYSRRKVRVVATSSTTAKGGDLLTVRLPQDVIDLGTISLWAKIKTTAAANKYASVADANLLVQYYQWTMGGRAINATFDYAPLWQTLHSYQSGDKADAHNLVCSLLPVSSSGNYTSPAANQDGTREICIDQFLGPLSTMSPQVLDLSILPESLLQIRFANPNEVMVTNDAAGGDPTFELSEISLECDILSLDPVYYQTIQSYLASGGVLECPFTQIYSFQGQSQGVNGAIQQFQVASQSIDTLFSTVYKSDNLAGDAASREFSGNVFNSKRFEKGLSTLTGVNVKINSVNYPLYGECSPARSAHSVVSTFMGGTKDTLGSCSKAISSFSNFQAYNYGHVTQLSHINDRADYGNRLISGLNSQGNPALVEVSYKGTGSSNVTPITWAFCTSSLLISQGKQIEVRD